MDQLTKLTGFRSLFRVAIVVAICSIIAKLFPLVLFLLISILVGGGFSPLVDFLQ